MKPAWSFLIVCVAVFAVLSLVSAAVSADVKVEEQVVGPVAEMYSSASPYVVSPRGVHLATVARKGSRVAVIVDGVEGPKFDETVAPTASYVDPRPFFKAQRAAESTGRQGPETGYRFVIFSKDGKRYAYVGRLSQEWVLMVDGKEVLRLPAEGVVSRATVAGASGTVSLLLEFTGDDGKHLMFARSVFGGYELWVDGQKMPGIYLSGGGGTEDTVDPSISRDGSRFAYVAQLARDKRTVIVDGKDAGYVADRVQFTGDGKHVVGVDRSKPNEHQVLMDGKPIVRARSLQALYVAPVGDKVVAVVGQPMQGGMQKSFLVVDGKQVEASVCESIPKVVFSPDGKRYAAACKASNNVGFVVVDGKKGQHYDGIWSPELMLAFSPDSSKVAYVAQSGGKFFVVVNEEESEGFDSVGVFAPFRFSPDGKRVAYCGRLSPTLGFRLYVDGKLERIDEQAICDSVTFSPDGSHYAYASKPSGSMYLDGKPTGLRGDKFAFTPDSKRVAVWGNRPSVDPKQGVLAQFARPAAQGMFVDGQHVFGDDNKMNLRYRAFTPDSQHVYWMTLERATGPNAKPGLIETVIYLDGKPVVRADRIDSGQVAWIYPGGQFNFGEPPPAWEIASDGVLTFVAPVGDVVKRFRVTPAADTNIATMITAAEAEAAKAKAEAEQKKPAPRGRRNR